MIKKGSEEKTKKIVDIEAGAEVASAPKENIIDVDLSPIQKKKFRLDGDNNRVIALNTSDLNIAIRLEEVYPKLLKMTNEASTKLEEISGKSEDDKKPILDLLKNLDKKMRDLVNYVFDSDVADKAAPDGSMYDPINGKFRFEYIIEKLADLYETNLNQEFELMQKRMNKHTAKYTGKKH